MIVVCRAWRQHSVPQDAGTGGWWERGSWIPESRAEEKSNTENDSGEIEVPLLGFLVSLMTEFNIKLGITPV